MFTRSHSHQTLQERGWRAPGMAHGPESVTQSRTPAPGPTLSEVPRKPFPAPALPALRVSPEGPFLGRETLGVVAGRPRDLPRVVGSLAI